MTKEKSLKKNESLTHAKEREEIVKALEKNKKSVDQEAGKEVNANINNKIEFLKRVYKRNEGDGDQNSKPSNKFSDRLSGSMDELINGMPSELIDLINSEIEFCLARDCNPIEVNERVKNMIYLLYLAYKDSRKYLDIYGRNYQELLLSDFIREICDSDYSEADWHRIARLNLNLNGLRTINIFGVEGHTSGNKFLEMFANILKKGRTVKALESLGVRVVPSAEGSDNFGWIMYGPYDLRLILSVAENLLLKEIEEADISQLIDFSDEKVQQVIKQTDLSHTQELSLRIMASIGSATLGEILENIEIPDNESYEHISKVLMNNMFKAADERAKGFKEAFKNKIKEENPYLYNLYSMSNIEMLEERIRELEEEVERLRGKV